MKIFVSHSTKSNFEDELYKPLRDSELAAENEFVFPHETGAQIVIKDVIRDCDLVIAECTQTDFEQGLELGWANGAYVTTVCFYKTGTQIPESLHAVSENVIAYDSVDSILQKIKDVGETL
jgi:hypothetical protein